MKVKCKHFNNGFAIFCKSSFVTALMGLAILANEPAAQAQSVIDKNDVSTSSREVYRETINSNTITVIGSGLSGGNIKMIDDIAAAVNNSHKLRVLPVLGEGSSQNIRDIIYLKGIDAGTVKLGSVRVYEQDTLFSDLRKQLQYIAILGIQEFHLVGNHSINSLEDLAGKKVGAHGGALGSMKDLLGRLNIEPKSLESINFFKGLEKIKTGELDALARVTASPMSKFDDQYDPKYHKVIPIPLMDSLIEDYLPGKLTHKAYPNIVPDGQPVQTVASPVALVAYAWKPNTERYRRVAKFAESFFSNMPKLLANKNRHSDWDNVNLYAELPGWTRFPAAQEWLDKHKPSVTENASVEKFGSTLATSAKISELDYQKVRSALHAFLKENGNANISDEKLDSLFRYFLEWRLAQEQR
jgi:TRAP-type uncharacterized transport system substrate-binding protein